MANDDNLGIIITAFVVILIGIIFTNVIATNIVGNTQLSSTTNESIVITGGSGKTANKNVESVSLFGNLTSSSCCNNIDNTSLVLGTHINFSDNGTIQVTRNFNISGAAESPIIFSDATYGITYKYRGSQYVRDATSRSLLPLTIVFWAISILLIIVGVAWYIFKRNGLI